MRRVMLAFLGTNDYIPCNYLLNGEKRVNNIRFIQEALATLFCKNWTEDDRLFIFVTEEAKSKNWVDNGHKDKDGKPKNIEGLKTRLDSLNLKVNIVSEEIPEGKKEDEIWNIFDNVFSKINDGDEIIFDITHGFRSLPMLAFVILNYAKVLKDIKISGVFYGAFESLGNGREVEKMNIENRNAPIFDLTPFIYLFEWTNATANFLTYGDAKDIHELTNQKIKPILKDTKGKDEKSKNLNMLSEQLIKFTKYIQTCRGLDIVKGYEIKILKEAVNNNKDSFIKPMNPLFEKISDKFENFDQNDVKNGYAAVEWCINHNLVQQGYTILLETIISQFVVKCFGKNEITNINKRELVSTAVYSKDSENDIKLSDSEKVDIQKLKNYMPEDFVRLYDTISQTRNDINHAGMRENPQKPKDLINNLKDYYNKFKAGEKDV